MLKLTGMGLKVFHNGDPPSMIGDMATINQKRFCKLLAQPEKPLPWLVWILDTEKEPVLEGILMPSHLCIWVYGLWTKGADSVIDALWLFFINAGSIPKHIRCNFDSRFVKGKV
jgi:hypothetical protein